MFPGTERDLRVAAGVHFISLWAACKICCPHGSALSLAHPHAQCYKAGVRARKILSFLLVLSVMSATFPGSAALAFATTGGGGPHIMEGCHEAMTAHADAHGQDAASHGQQHDRDDTDSPQSRHDCCTGFVGLVSPTGFFPLLHGARETPLFRPSLRLAANMTGIYRPPRQHS